MVIKLFWTVVNGRLWSSTMSRLALLPVLIVIACTSPTTPDRELTETPSVARLPSTSNRSIETPPDDRDLRDTANIAFDSSLYIGEVSMFPETGEVYTSVYYHEGVVMEGLFDYLQAQTDSVIYEDGEIRRARLPTSTARKYFNLFGLDVISVYQNARYVSNARFMRVEYMEGAIDGQFIAVFKPLQSVSLPEELDYCISDGAHHYKAIPVAYKEIRDEQLTEKLLEAFAGDDVRVFRTSHISMSPYQSVYSAVSMQSRLLLIETERGESHILMDLKEDWLISDITPLHLESNGKPILLLRMGINETDMMWSAVAVFSGEAYVFAEGNRL